jgi:hypothetical protein
MLKQIRQGDVLLVSVSLERPANIKPLTEVILAEGEITGHAHRIKAKEIYQWEAQGQWYIQVDGEIGELSHEEHDPLPAKVIEPGVTYRIVPQKEWNLDGQWQKVQD